MEEFSNFCSIFAEERLHLSKVQANLTLRSIGTFFATVFVTTTMVLLASCSQDDDYYDSDMYTLAETGTRLAEGGDSGDPFGNICIFPAGYVIKEDAGVQAKMKEAWKRTIEFASPSGRREYGFWIYYHYETGKITCGDLIEGDVITGGPGTHGSISFVNSDMTNETCAFFHTHTPVRYCGYGASRITGDSEVDRKGADGLGIPGLVYDYTAPEISSTDDINSAAHVRTFGTFTSRLPIIVNSH